VNGIDVELPDRTTRWPGRRARPTQRSIDEDDENELGERMAAQRGVGRYYAAAVDLIAGAAAAPCLYTGLLM